KILSMSCSKSPSQEIYVLGASQQLDEGALAAVRASLGADILPKKENRRLLELADRCGAAYEELEQYAVYRTLWASDAEGVISSLWLDAAGELHSEVYEMSETFPADSLF